MKEDRKELGDEAKARITAAQNDALDEAKDVCEEAIEREHLGLEDDIVRLLKVKRVLEEMEQKVRAIESEDGTGLGNAPKPS